MTDKVKALLLGLVEDLEKGKLTKIQQSDLLETLVSLTSSFRADEVDAAAPDVEESAADVASASGGGGASASASGGGGGGGGGGGASASASGGGGGGGGASASASASGGGGGGASASASASGGGGGGASASGGASGGGGGGASASGGGGGVGGAPVPVPVPAIGDALFGLDGKSWGRIVDQTKTAWILEDGRIAKKENEGKKWTFKHDGKEAFVVKLVLREAIRDGEDVGGFLVTYCVPVHKFALERFGHCSCNGTAIPESETHTLTYGELVDLAKKQVEPRCSFAKTTDPRLLEIYRKILLTNNKKELLKGSEKMREPW
jgi:hypothetical protein